MVVYELRPKGGVPNKKGKPRPKAKDAPNLERLPQTPQPSPRLVVMTTDRGRLCGVSLVEVATAQGTTGTTTGRGALDEGEGWLVNITWHQGLKALPPQGQVMTKTITTDRGHDHETINCETLTMDHTYVLWNSMVLRLMRILIY
ncbi:hypothetical protein MTR67_018001 [Solanum verrucosum]|uniref:Uncharacterized protein n=1 Tax=Solanum verrucosum TaxID=315347 RepID=A0AAF0QJW3_SOLVR|nr:hypothetical protein MTR67_018001 [Solanum verrucosum]